MKKLIALFVLLVLSALVMTACGGSQPENCLGTAEDAIVDLECREITIAMENAYLPFNYISLETGEPGGWDYEAWDEVCKRLHCTPVYTEAAWEGMIQAVADGQFDDCNVTTRDLARIIESLTNALEAQFHSRVMYPWQEKRIDFT